jgi:hypothetical protein
MQWIKVGPGYGYGSSTFLLKEGDDEKPYNAPA